MKTPKIVFTFLFLLLILGCSKDSTNPDNGTPTVDKSGNLKALGASANELLSDTKFTSLNIEVVYVTGFKPSDAALNNVAQFLGQHTFKPDGVTITTRAVTSSNKAPFSIEEIAQIEKDERIAYNAGDEIAVFIYVADGSNENDENNKVVLGSAFRNTSVVLYGKTINNIANNSSAQKSDVESAVLNHEFGHLFGLVDVGSPMQVNHEDPESEAHCNVDGCLMTANIEFGSGIVDMVNNNNVPELDDLCINDLVANGGR